MEELAVRPFVAEVVFHEFPAVVVHGVHQIDGLLFVADALEHAAELEFARGIQKHGKRIGAVAEKIRRAAADDDARASFPRPAR